MSDNENLIWDVERYLADMEKERDDYLKNWTARYVRFHYRYKSLLEKLDQTDTAADSSVAVRPEVGAPVTASAVPVVTGRAANVILEALAQAGAAGVSGADLTKAVYAANMGRDATEKAKAKLKRLGLVRHDMKARHWYLAAGPGTPQDAG